MRIAIVGPAYPYKGGGAQHTTELAHRLTAAGHDVTIESWHAQYPSLLYPGQQTIDAPEGRRYPGTRRELAWYRPDGWWRVGRRVGREADLVILTVLTPAQAVPYRVLAAGVGGRARTMALCHNVLPHERRPGDLPLTRALLRRVDTVLTHTPHQGELARGLLPTAQHPKVRTARLPPHLPRTAAPAAADTETVFHELLFFGIVRPYKGVDLLLHALAAGPRSVGLTVVGEFWGGGSELADLAHRLGVADRVELRDGYVPAEELPRYFATADALVLPYRSATASQNVWLAFEHRCPVIATRVGSLAEHVRDGVDGLLCEPDNVTDLTRALQRFYTPGTPQRLRAAVTPVDPEPHWRNYLATLLG